MTATGAHRVTIDPARVNHWAPTAFYGVIKADDDWFLFNQICHEMLEKYFRQITRFPLGAIENLVEELKDLHSALPVIRRQDDTVLLPSANSAPIVTTQVVKHGYFQVSKSWKNYVFSGIYQ